LLKQALACLAKEKLFDAIIMDWKMPELDGVETLREINALHLTNSPFVIMATAYDSHDLENELVVQNLTAANINIKPMRNHLFCYNFSASIIIINN
jgi:CheY-like chemotaxis protein